MRGPTLNRTTIRCTFEQVSTHGGKYKIKMPRMTYWKCEQILNQRAFVLADRARHTFEKEYLLHTHGESVMNSSVRSSFSFDSHSSFTSTAAAAEAAACARGLSYLDAVIAVAATTATDCSRHGRTRENKSDKRTVRRHGYWVVITIKIIIVGNNNNN